MSDMLPPETCPHCGAERSGQRFCPHCGKRLAGWGSFAQFVEAALTAALVIALGALGYGCIIGSAYGVCWGVSFVYPPMREALWAWTIGGLLLVVVLHKLALWRQDVRYRRRVERELEEQRGGEA